MSRAFLPGPWALAALRGVFSLLGVGATMGSRAHPPAPDEATRVVDLPTSSWGLRLSGCGQGTRHITGNTG